MVEVMKIMVKVKLKTFNPTLGDPVDCKPTRLFCPWDFPDKNTGVGCHFLLQEIFPTQGLNPCLLHCRQRLYCLSHQGTSKIMVTHVSTATLSAPNPAAGHRRPTPPLETPGLPGKSGSVSCGVTSPFSWVLVRTRFCL